MNHKDSMGYSNIVEKDWVQIMSAGSGLKHEEYNIGEDEVNFLQIWILPKLHNILPRYQWREFPRLQRKNQLTTIISNEEGLKHCWINQNTKMLLGFYDAGQKVTYNFNPVNKCLFIFTIEGAIRVAGKEIPGRDAIGIWDVSDVEIETLSESDFLIIETPVNQK
jgi:redox-sensitive bicupin YhaK (pirin superfamily)